MSTQTQTAISVQTEEEVEQQYLLFHSADLLIGVEVGYVMETLINTAITHLPLMPNYVRGVVNLRGEVIPVVDVRRHLGQYSETDDSMIVVNIDGMRMGILVDRVDQMVKLYKSQIQPLPARNTQRLLCGMATLADGRTMLVLDCPALLET